MVHHKGPYSCVSHSSSTELWKVLQAAGEGPSVLEEQALETVKRALTELKGQTHNNYEDYEDRSSRHCLKRNPEAILGPCQLPKCNCRFVMGLSSLRQQVQLCLQCFLCLRMQKLDFFLSPVHIWCFLWGLIMWLTSAVTHIQLLKSMLRRNLWLAAVSLSSGDTDITISLLSIEILPSHYNIVSQNLFFFLFPLKDFSY